VKLAWRPNITDTVDDVARAVRRDIKYGADWIKLMATGGVMDPISDYRVEELGEEQMAKAVEVCATKKCIYLTYGKYKYGNIKSSLTDFKERNGFEEVLVPRYYIPVTMRGRIALAFNLHHGVKSFMPPKVLGFITRVRSGFFKRFAVRETLKSNPSEIAPADASGVAGKS
jgi:hypothetical protein